MAQAIIVKPSKRAREGIPCSEEQIKETKKTWQDIEDSIKYCMKHKVKK